MQIKSNRQVREGLEYALAAISDKAKALEAENAALVRRNTELSAAVRSAPADNSKKLTPGDVRRLREEYRTTGMTQRELAEIWDLNRATVSRIVRGIYHPRVR